MRHHVLIPTDFSENAWSAALYAIKLYANQAATFYFSHAWTFVNTGSRTYISPSYIDKLKDDSKAQLTALQERAKLETINTDHEFQTLFSDELLIDSIKYAIKKHHINLVVMGTKGATGAKEFLLGSNTVSVINKIWLCPILLVPNTFEFVKPQHIAFPTDLNRIYDEELLPILKLADLHKSKIEVLHITGKDGLSEIQETNREALKVYLEAHPHSFHFVPDKGTKEHAILNFIEQKTINIVTMVNYEHSFLEDFIKEPVIRKLGFHSIIPFLVVPRIE
ncbi:universal stress protein [Gelidibacter mesophilus]|uniref:universal stress protein n=1 Tax=Gelidibacter mesophilus TaxID=169050 RepID=UPI000402F1F8|nr:universal stress protein [Gelidibacter mesophilus]